MSRAYIKRETSKQLLSKSENEKENDLVIRSSGQYTFVLIQAYTDPTH